MSKFIKWGLIAFGILVLIAVIPGCSRRGTTTTTTTTRERARERQTTTTSAPAPTKQQQQQAYLAFEDNLFSIEQPAAAATRNLDDTLTRLDNGKATKDEAVSAAKLLKLDSEQATKDYNNLSVPSNLPPNVIDLCNKARLSASAAYTELGKAADAVIRSLNAPDGSTEQANANKETNDHLNEYSRLLAAEDSNLLAAREQLGLPVKARARAKLQDLFR